MFKLSNILCIVLLLFSYGCAAIQPATYPVMSQVPNIVTGQVLGLAPGSTVWGITKVLSDAPGTIALEKGDLAVMAWNIKDYWAFIIVNTSRDIGVSDVAGLGGGNIVNSKTMGDFVDCLKSNDWEVVSGSAVLKVGAAAAESWAVTAAESMTTFVFIPVTSETFKNYEGVKQ